MEILLGSTKNKDLVFCKIENYPEFKVSFYIKEIVNFYKLSDIKYFELIKNEFNAQEIQDMCISYNCSLKDLPKILFYGIFPKEDIPWYYINDNKFILHCIISGQYDSREEMEEYTNQRIYKTIHLLWEQFHLKKNKIYLSNMIEFYINFDEEKWINEYISKNFEILERR